PRRQGTHLGRRDGQPEEDGWVVVRTPRGPFAWPPCGTASGRACSASRPLVIAGGVALALVAAEIDRSVGDDGSVPLTLEMSSNAATWLLATAADATGRVATSAPSPP